jgi:hypothetical protein
VTWANVFVKATDIENVIATDEMPPTPSKLTESQKKTLFDYIAAGTPSAGNVTCP